MDTNKIPHGFQTKMISVMNHQVHTLIGGISNQGTAMVMIHGALASRRYLLPTATLLANYMQVLIPEMPGHGASSKPPRALTVKQQANVLSGWFEVIGLRRANIFANSYGCQVAAQLVADHPDVVDRLILTSPTTDPAARNLIKQAYRLYMDGFSEPKGAQAQFFADLSDMGIYRAFETARIMVQDDIRRNLTKITAPTLVLRGHKDPLVPSEWAQEVAATLSNAQFCDIPEAPHCVNYATPAHLTKIILEFIGETRCYATTQAVSQV
jgi:2-hydroxy-6-oxonona-2,4-dienedioate hydrolase